MKDGMDGKTMTEFVGLRPKTYSYLMDDGKSDKKAKGTCVIMKICNNTNTQVYENCLLNNETILTSEQR